MLTALALLVCVAPLLPEVGLLAALVWGEWHASRAGMLRAPRAPWTVVLDTQSLSVLEPGKTPVRLPFAGLRAARRVDWAGFEVPRGWSPTLVLDLTGPSSRAVKIPLDGLRLDRTADGAYRAASPDRTARDDGACLVEAVRGHVAVDTVYLDSPVNGWV